MNKIRSLLIKKPEDKPFAADFNSRYLFTEGKQLSSLLAGQQEEDDSTTAAAKSKDSTEIVPSSSAEVPQRRIVPSIFDMFQNKEAGELGEEEPSEQVRWEILFLINRMLLKTRPYDSIEFFCLQRQIRRYLGLEGKAKKKRDNGSEPELGIIQKMCCFKGT